MEFTDLVPNTDVKIIGYGYDAAKKKAAEATGVPRGGPGTPPRGQRARRAAGHPAGLELKKAWRRPSRAGAPAGPFVAAAA